MVEVEVEVLIESVHFHAVRQASSTILSASATISGSCSMIVAVMAPQSKLFTLFQSLLYDLLVPKRSVFASMLISPVTASHLLESSLHLSVVGKEVLANEPRPTP